MSDKKWLFAGCILLQGLIYGFGNVITKIAYESITPFWCLVFRFGLATLAFLLFFHKSIFQDLKNAHWKNWLPSSLCMAVGYVTANVALHLTGATIVSFLMALPIIFTPLFARVVIKSPYRLMYVPAQIAVVFGLYLFCSNGGSFVFGLGEVLALITSVSVAGAFVFGERGLRELDVVTISTTQTALTFILSLVGAFLFEPGFQIAAVEPIAWVIILYLALPCTCLAFALQNIALTGISSTAVSMLTCSEPIFTAVIAWVALGEALSLRGFIGGAVILLCILAETYFEGQQPKSVQVDMKE